MPCGFLWQPVCSVLVVILRFVMASAGVLFVGSTGAFFLLVPVFSIMTVASILVGLMLVFGLGFEAGIRNGAKDALLAVTTCEEEKYMNWDQIEGMWKQLTGSAREQWGKLTEDDWQTIAGKKDQLVGRIQERYGIAKAEAEKQADEWSHAQKQSEEHDSHLARRL